MATTVTVDADDLAYLAELAGKHLMQVSSPAEYEAAVAPIFRAFRSLEEEAPCTFAHQFDLWALASEVDEKGGAW